MTLGVIISLGLVVNAKHEALHALRDSVEFKCERYLTPAVLMQSYLLTDDDIWRVGRQTNGGANPIVRAGVVPEITTFDPKCLAFIGRAAGNRFNDQIFDAKVDSIYERFSLPDSPQPDGIYVSQ